MSREKRIRQTLPSQCANWLKAFAAQLKVAATKAWAAAGRRVLTMRKWSAPRVDRTGQVLQDSVAPKVASALSSAAQRLDPGRPRHARWRKPAGVATLSAAASAAAALAQRRRKRDGQDAAEDGHNGNGGPAPAAEGGDNRVTANADRKGRGGAS